MPPGWEQLISTSGITVEEVQNQPKEVIKSINFHKSWVHDGLKAAEPLKEAPMPKKADAVMLGKTLSLFFVSKFFFFFKQWFLQRI